MGHSRGSFSWVKLVVILGHSCPLVILMPRAPGYSEIAKIPENLVKLWLLVTFSKNSNIYNLLYAFLFFLHSSSFRFSSGILKFYPP